MKKDIILEYFISLSIGCVFVAFGIATLIGNPLNHLIHTLMQTAQEQHKTLIGVKLINPIRDIGIPLITIFSFFLIKYWRISLGYENKKRVTSFSFIIFNLGVKASFIAFIGLLFSGKAIIIAESCGWYVNLVMATGLWLTFDGYTKENILLELKKMTPQLIITSFCISLVFYLQESKLIPIQQDVLIFLETLIALLYAPLSNFLIKK